jgi:hypothetical protein
MLTRKAQQLGPPPTLIFHPMRQNRKKGKKKRLKIWNFRFEEEKTKKKIFGRRQNYKR